MSDVHDIMVHSTGHGFSSYGVAPKGAGGGSKFGGADSCPRCGQRVYAAEKVVGAGQVGRQHVVSSSAINVIFHSPSLGTRPASIVRLVGRSLTPPL